MTERETKGKYGEAKMPECLGENVKPIESWDIHDLKVTEPPKPMWACTDPMCLHKWERTLPNPIAVYHCASTKPASAKHVPVQSIIPATD